LPYNIAIFASGGGSNAEVIIQHFSKSAHINVTLIVSTKSDAHVLTRAQNHSIDTLILDKELFSAELKMLSILSNKNIEFIVLAGFLWLVPAYLVKAYPQKIVNIHPALLPDYGGKGMYGKRVHQSVFDNNERHTGMTIHYVDEHYDEGNIIFQAQVDLLASDTPDIIAQKVLELEHKNYARIIESIILNQSD